MFDLGSYVETFAYDSSDARTPFLRMGPLSARIAVVISDLATKSCVPCRGGVPPLKGEELAALEKQVEDWNVIEGHHLAKTFTFPDFREALKFVNRVGDLAEEQGHHPDLFLAWGKVAITIWTHKINGLTESDFILAAKIDQLHKS
jgi:4a-hydroxytetrahydrobiopterin dehydratase